MSLVRTSDVGRHRLATAVMVVAIGMVPWVVFLALTLPQRYQAAHWNVLWVGFDVALVLVLVSTALTAWLRRQIVAPLLLVAATLLVCDAWFDVVTSFGRQDGWVSIVTAVCGELPLACAFFWLYYWIVLGSIREARRRAGDPHPPRRLRDVRVLALEAPSAISPQPLAPFVAGVAAPLGPEPRPAAASPPVPADGTSAAVLDERSHREP